MRELLDRPGPVALDDPDAADAAYRAVWIWRFTTDQGDQGQVTIRRSWMCSVRNSEPWKRCRNDEFMCEPVVIGR